MEFGLPHLFIDFPSAKMDRKTIQEIFSASIDDVVITHILPWFDDDTKWKS